MADLARLRIDLSGTAVVGASVMTFYSSGAGVGLPAAAKTWLTSLAANFPAGLTFTVPSGGDLVNEVNGALTGSWTASGGGTVTGSGSSAYTLGSGLRVKWTTSGITAGRRVRGTTFLVPVIGAVFGTDGRVTSASASSITTATSTFLSSVTPDLCVWSRPTASRSGTHSAVTGFSIPTLPTQLRSRRT